MQSGKDTRKDEEEEGKREKAAPVGGIEDPGRGQNEEGQHHDEQLHTRSDKGGEQTASRRRSEDVPMHKFPASYVGICILVVVAVGRVVGLNVAREGSHQDEEDHATEHHDNDGRVYNGQPMDLVRIFVVDKVEVPSRRPFDGVVFLPKYAVGVGNCEAVHPYCARLRELQRGLIVERGGACAGLCFDRLWVDFKGHNDLAVAVCLQPAPPEDQADVIMKLCHVILKPAQLEAGRVVLFGAVDGDEGGGAGQVVHDPFGRVAVADELGGARDAGSIDGRVAQVRTGHVLAHLDLVAGRRDAVAAQNLAQVEGDPPAAAPRGIADKGQLGVGVGQGGGVRGDLVGLQGDCVPVGVRADAPAGDVEAACLAEEEQQQQQPPLDPMHSFLVASVSSGVLFSLVIRHVREQQRGDPSAPATVQRQQGFCPALPAATRAVRAAAAAAAAQSQPQLPRLERPLGPPLPAREHPPALLPAQPQRQDRRRAGGATGQGQKGEPRPPP